VLFVGAILARPGQATLRRPGGCELGPRPIDLHLAALRTLGARIVQEEGGLRCAAPRLTGGRIDLALPSVGATENSMLCACGAQGTTTILNAAREPEIVDLQNFLNAMGARVRGAGSSVICVEGGRPLHAGEHTAVGDRIVAATYLAAAAAAGGDVVVRGADWRHLSTVTAVLQEAGCQVHSGQDEVRLTCVRPLTGVGRIPTAPYPGFPTDAQPQVMAALATARGDTVFVENIFADRYRHVDQLNRMGAQIQVEGRAALVRGVPRLHGCPVRAPDLRGGAALAVAALGADGESVLTGLRHIDRGYEQIENDLAALGAQVRRME
jgi:UDP-N-acetylglucosamine 1-carboxyvinyltransferase